MPWTDAVVYLFIYLQPPFIGLLLALAIYRGLSVAPYFSWLVGARRHRKNVRFFECAARPRLLSFFSYEIPFLAFCALFILYDADLLFFLPEVVSGEF
jgi:NADH:ubiquinone oxidoreductase subunit 3 (subunit A)